MSNLRTSASESLTTALKEAEQFNPYAAPDATAISGRPVVGSRLRGVTLALTCIQALIISGGAVAAVINIESIPFTGMLHGTIAILLLFCFARLRQSLGQFWSLTAILFCVAIYAVIAVLRLDPAAAQRPIGGAIMAYSTVMLPIGALALYRILKTKC